MITQPAIPPIYGLLIVWHFVAKDVHCKKLAARSKHESSPHAMEAASY